jgi:uncharacterized phage protein (TIGR01671 family)
MTRLIKFRVWNTYAKCFYPRDHFALDMDGIELQKMVSCEHHQEVFSRNPGGQESMVFMQFTGLKDKNGKEIYEGDILMHADTKYEVEFDNAQFLFRFQWEDKRNHWFSFNEMGFTVKKTHPESEIIGNIYENPELIK